MTEAPSGVLYADTSALVKLVVNEAGSYAVEQELGRWQGIATSSITPIELARAILRARLESRPSVSSRITGQDVAAAVAEIPLTARVRSVAATLEPATLRTLDAIHLASALALDGNLGGLLTYDVRLADAARSHDIAVVAPV